MPGNEDLAYLQVYHDNQHSFRDIKLYVRDLEGNLAFVTQHNDAIQGDERTYFAVLFSLANAGEILDQLVKGHDERGNNEVVSRLGLQDLGHAPEGESRNNIQHRGKLVGIRDRIVHYQSKIQNKAKLI